MKPGRKPTSICFRNHDKGRYGGRCPICEKERLAAYFRYVKSNPALYEARKARVNAQRRGKGYGRRRVVAVNGVE